MSGLASRCEFVTEGISFSIQLVNLVELDIQYLAPKSQTLAMVDSDLMYLFESPADC